MYEQSHAIISALDHHHRLPVMGWLIITVITPLPTKPACDKNARKLKLANAAITDMQMRQRGVAAAGCKIRRADAKAENDALRDDVCRWSSSVAHQAVCQSVREATTASGVDNASLPDRHR